MRRFTAILVILLFVASIGVMATTKDDIQTPNLPGVGLGEMYNRDDILRVTEVQPVPLPSPPQEPNGFIELGKPGPVAIDSSNSKFDSALGSALVAPRGGAVLSAEQRADRQIRQLIRRLD